MFSWSLPLQWVMAFAVPHSQGRVGKPWCQREYRQFGIPPSFKLDKLNDINVEPAAGKSCAFRAKKRGGRTTIPLAKSSPVYRVWNSLILRGDAIRGAAPKRHMWLSPKMHPRVGNFVLLLLTSELFCCEDKTNACGMHLWTIARQTPATGTIIIIILHILHLRRFAHLPEKLQIVVFEHLEYYLVGDILRDSVVEVAKPEYDVGLPKQGTKEEKEAQESTQTPSFADTVW